MVNNKLKFFSIDVYALLDPGATLFFVTPLIENKIDILPDTLYEPFMCLPQWVSKFLQRGCLEIVL